MKKRRIRNRVLFYSIPILLIACWAAACYAHIGAPMIHILLIIAILLLLLEPLSKSILVWLSYTYFYENQKSIRENRTGSSLLK